MQLAALVTKDDLALVVEQLTPLQIDLGANRCVALGRPQRLELVPNKGLRLRGDAKLSWDVAGLTLPVTLRAWQVLLEPNVIEHRDGAFSLRFEPQVEELDLRNLPAFLDGKIAAAINEGIASQKKKLAWNITKSLGVRLELPKRVSPKGRFELTPSGVKLFVTQQAIELTVTFASGVAHALEREPATVNVRAPAYAR